MAKLKLSEFDVWQDESGMYKAQHQRTGRQIEADTLPRLELLACAVHLGITLNEANDVHSS